MKTKEINVWIASNDVKKITPDCTDSMTVYTRECFTPSIKAKLIVELPERKAEITESQLQQLLDEIRTRSSAIHSIDAWMKQKIFGGEG